jgi:hypothetical protein
VNPKDRKRLNITHSLLQAVRSKEFRDATAETTRRGEHVVTSALPDDTMAGLFEQVRTIDGPLHVAVPDGDGFELFVMEPYARPRHAYSQAAEQDRCPISPDTHVGMVLEYLRVRGAPIFCYEASPNVAFKLIDEALADKSVC